MLLPLLLAQAVPAAPPPQRPDVIVVAPRDGLAKCIARGCAPADEAAAALAAANAEYLAGDYRAARRTVGASLARLRGQARAHPQAVADLLDGAARLDAHLGEFDAHLTEMRRALLIVRDAYGATDARTIARRAGLADAYLTAGRQQQGFAEWAGAVEDADRGTNAELAWRTRLRFATALVRQSRGGDERQRVERLLAPVLASIDPSLNGYRLAARAVMAKLAARRGDDRPLAAVAAELATAAPAPVLVAAEQARVAGFRPVEDSCEPTNPGTTGAHARIGGGGGGITTLLGCGNANEQRTAQPFEKQWLDMSFDVAADGSVGNVRVARQSGQIEGPWIDEVVKTVGARRYAPRPNGAPTTRVERYTLTARFYMPTGTRIPVREAKPVIEVVDISADRAPYLAASR